MPTVQICGVSASYAFTNWSLLRLSDCARTLEEEAAPELGGHMKSGEQRRGSVLPPNIGYVQWFKIEIFTVSTKWTFICNFENLSKVALWVSFEPYRSVSMCLLFSRCAIFSHAFHHISPQSWWNKNTSLSSLWNHKHICVSFSCCLGFILFFSPRLRFICSRNNQSPPSILTFSNLEKAASPVRSRHKWKRQKILLSLASERGEPQSQQCPKEHKSLMSVFVISLANGTADPTGLKQPAQHFENTLYQQSEAKRTTESSGLKQRIQQFTAHSVRYNRQWA